MKYVRIYADPSGELHLEDLEVAFSPIDSASPAPPMLHHLRQRPSSRSFVAQPVGMRIGIPHRAANSFSIWPAK